MAIPRLRIHPSHAADLACIREIGIDKIVALADSADNISPPPFSSKALREAFEKQIGEEQARSLVDVCLFLSALRRDSDFSATEVLNGVRSGLAALSEEHRWSNEEMAVWTLVEAPFAKLLESESVEGVAKYLELSYDYGKLWRNGRILTDVRPVFNRDRTKVRGSLVSFTMRLQYEDLDGLHGVSLAMDERDVKKLIEECERALVKAVAAKSFAEAAGGIPTFVTGRDDAEE